MSEENQNNINGTVPTPQPMPATEPVPQPQPMPATEPAPQPIEMQAPPVNPSMTAPHITSTPSADPMSVISNLNKEEAMEEALSHTGQHTPFVAPEDKPEPVPEGSNKFDKKTIVFIAIIFIIIIAFIIALPYISQLFGWIV